MKLLIAILTCLPFLILGQGNNDCNSAAVLCGNQTQFSDNSAATVEACNGCQDGSTLSGNFCYELNNTVWFSFTTNTVGGDVSVDISNIICDNTAGYNQSLQASIISASSPCNESTYNLVSNCVSGNASDFSLTASSLLANTTYYIQIDGDSIAGNTSAAQCGFNITTTGPGVEISIEAGPNSTIFAGDIATLSGSGPSNSTWSPSSIVSNASSPETTTNPESTTTYYYSTTTADGCVYTDEATVIVQPPLTIFNTFSPNDDGINDYWSISSIQNYLSAKITVFDRWGQKVYNSVGYSNSKYWDGTMNGNGSRLPSGVYYYIIDLNTESDNDIFSGYVTIIL